MKFWTLEIVGWIVTGLIGLLVVLMAPCVFSLWGNAVCRVVMGIN